jgi:leader peptidase (prepilin peptidase)/N-methyltransferase
VITNLHPDPALVVFAAGLLGLVVGSFLNVVALRVPPMLDHAWRRQCREYMGMDTAALDSEPVPGLISPPSRCPHCGHQIRPWENIPVVSFIFLRGRCSECGERISWRYPVVELASAGLSCVVAWHFGFTPAAGAALVLTWALLALAVIDIDHQLLPDAITLPFLWIGLLVNTFGMFTTLQSAVIGAAAGYASLWLVYHGFRLLTGKEGMGFGDFKLFALFGAWLGWQSLPVVILLASLVGAVLGLISISVFGRDRQLPIPFGPYLAAAGWAALLWSDKIIDAYLRYATG